MRIRTLVTTAVVGLLAFATLTATRPRRAPTRAARTRTHIVEIRSPTAHERHGIRGWPAVDPPATFRSPIDHGASAAPSRR